MDTVRRCIGLELARAEAVAADESGIHPPTKSHHEGQALAYTKVLSLLEIEESQVREPIELHRQTTITITSPAAIIMAIVPIIAAIAIIINL